ncbi:major tail protein [Lysinibacillus sp. 38-6]|uniref:major tail protein n=1 Tax=Lysinibacillus sp. 38-6 TaxID=3385991 RepID=UPI00390896BC
MEENKVRYGLTNVHIAPLTMKEGKIEYADFKSMPGAVNLVLNPKGEQTPFHADNRTYHVFNSNQGYDGTLEIAEIPEFFLTEILGEQKINGLLVENINAKGKSFAMAFEFDGDKKATRHVLYNCTASRPTLSGKTNADNIEAQTSELTFTAAPGPDGTTRAKSTLELQPEIYNAWYTKPVDPMAIVTKSTEDTKTGSQKKATGQQEADQQTKDSQEKEETEEAAQSQSQDS